MKKENKKLDAEDEKEVSIPSVFISDVEIKEVYSKSKKVKKKEYK